MFLKHRHVLLNSNDRENRKHETWEKRSASEEVKKKTAKRKSAATLVLPLVSYETFLRLSTAI